jgi:hypothetical protein
MSRAKRTPIDYTPQFAEGIFRPKDVVEEELAQDAQPATPDSAPSTPPPQPSSRSTRTAHTAPVVIDILYRSVQQKQRLASSTFRFQPEELAELDAVAAEIQLAAPGKISKNDVVRLALNWLLSDYRRNKEQSTLGKVVQRI